MKHRVNINTATLTIKSSRNEQRAAIVFFVGRKS